MKEPVTHDFKGFWVRRKRRVVVEGGVDDSGDPAKRKKSWVLRRGLGLEDSGLEIRTPILRSSNYSSCKGCRSEGDIDHLVFLLSTNSIYRRRHERLFTLYIEAINPIRASKMLVLSSVIIGRKRDSEYGMNLLGKR
jgi:hypothetical protein